jgi:hypothetical protein
MLLPILKSSITYSGFNRIASLYSRAINFVIFKINNRNRIVDIVGVGFWFLLECIWGEVLFESFFVKFNL